MTVVEGLTRVDNVPVSETLHLSCATRLNFVRWGQPGKNKPVCLLLHGLDNNARVWDSLAQRLGQYFTVYALDFRGHGESQWCDSQSYTTQQLVVDIENFRLHLKLEKFYLIGHSLGGRVGAYYTALYPDVVISLVLADVSIKTNSMAIKKMRDDHRNAPSFFSSELSYYQYLQNIYLLAEEKELQHFAKHNLNKQYVRYYVKTDPQCKDAILNKILDEARKRAVNSSEIIVALKKIKQPTLILRGEYSAILEASDVDKMLGLLANGKTVSINVAGHAIMMDNPEESIYAIEAFLLESL